jgi:hypothetical protein
LEEAAKSAKTLRGWKEANEHAPTGAREKADAAAAIMAHADAVRGHASFPIGNFDTNVGDRAKVQEQLDWLARLTDRSVSVPEKMHVAESANGRASCDMYGLTSWKSRDVTLNLSKGETTQNVFHEQGHAIEASDRGRGHRASAFLDARTAGDAVGKLKDHTGIQSYGDHEIARPDKFTNPYVGKDYGRESVGYYNEEYFGPKKAHDKGGEEGGKSHKATEVTSMGIERMSASGWSKAFQDDPDHFYFALGQLGGY